MAQRQLSVVAGALARSSRPKGAQTQDALAKRWRAITVVAPQPRELSDVIPLMDAWIRRLEREAGTAPAPQER